MYSPVNFDPKNWQDFEPHYQALLHETLTPAHLSEWLHRWSELEKYVWELRAGFKRARSRLELSHQFEPDVNWSSYEHECAHGWQQDGRIFGQPFYMLEYALAHMGALQLYQNACIDHQATWRMYREALTLGGTRRLPELFQAAGADFPLQPGVVESVAGFLATTLRG